MHGSARGSRRLYGKLPHSPMTTSSPGRARERPRLPRSRRRCRMEEGLINRRAIGTRVRRGYTSGPGRILTEDVPRPMPGGSESASNATGMVTSCMIAHSSLAPLLQLSVRHCLEVSVMTWLGMRVVRSINAGEA